MILGDPARASETAPAERRDRLTIDEIFRRAVKRRPDALALADAANRESFTVGAPRRLSYAEADRAAAAIAGRLRDMGLPTDTIVGVQLPNIVENILTILGILRAGMIAAPLPLLWRRADAVAALARIGAKALVTCGRVGNFDHGQFAMTVAADVFSVRYVCGFGTNLSDGIVSFDDLLTATPNPAPTFASDIRDDAVRHLAAVTFDVGEGGVVPVARNHAELLAGGLAVVLESGLAENANILSTIPPASFAGLCLTLLPWLLGGGTLVLHHPFDVGVWIRQRREDHCGTLVLPAPVALQLGDTSAFAVDRPASVIAAWHAPENFSASPAWRDPHVALVDVPIFGEVAVIPSCRGTDGRPRPLSLGAIRVPHGSLDGAVVAELTRTAAGTAAWRGPMVPHQPFPPGIERSGLPYFKIGPQGWLDSGYVCRLNSVADAIMVNAPPAGVVNVGGYRFVLRDLQDLVSRIDSAATVAALPDRILGRRLIGTAVDHATVQAVLNTVGVNPLVVAAFGDRGDPDDAKSDAA